MFSIAGGDGDVPLHGTVVEGFEPVVDAFRSNFTDRGDRGAACAVYHEGEKVVDLWGGYRDRFGLQPWTEDTLVLVYSTTKGMAATAVALARDRGHFEYDDYVVDHWREFGRHGKHGITVRELLDHQAGLATIDGGLAPETVREREPLVDYLANKKPEWTPGEYHGYHALTLGWYESELLRRTDPRSRTVAEFFADEIRDPLDLEFFIGQPDHVDDDRIADLSWLHPRWMAADVPQLPAGLALSVLNPFSAATKSLNPFGFLSPATMNDPAYRTCEMPAGTGIGRVRDLAKVYGDLAAGGDRVGLSGETLAKLIADPVPPDRGRHDRILRMEASYSLGFCRPVPGFDFGSTTAFGHLGAGGSLAFADPENGIGFAYAPNRMGSRILNDPRAGALRTAVYDCIRHS